MTVYVCWEGFVEEGAGRKLCYKGGRKDCVWVKENIGVFDVLRLVEEVMGEGLRGRLMWYSLKCNRMELLPLGRDADVGKLMKGNDEYAYVYVVGSEGRRGGESVSAVDGGARAEAGGVGSEQVPRSATEDNTEELGLKVDKRKTELQKWKNGVGGRIKMKLQKTLANIGCVAYVKPFNTALGEYGVSLTNNRSLVVNLARRTCSCKWWQLQGLPCAHAMAVIDKHKLWVYDYVSDYYKWAAQGTIYMNSILPMETHDSATVENAIGLVVGGDALDDGYNRTILPPINPRPQGRPRQRRIESQTQGVQIRRCSKCGEGGHYRSTCRNPRSDFNADNRGVLVAVEDLFDGHNVQQ
ncbi:hypothetical protein Cgig2_001174 [Carnegiea gigantea]|uniref:CCHC-type domain-containing protein n=1 Tax=Carnegiea gigantea TaxID=171969 RepID=A0A9Q1JWA8_9CARY|nr:hypothetical protein Cgig2_001174 [Carnegiea gigantea]